MPIEILLVVDDEASMRPLEDQLTEVAPFQFIIEFASDITEATQRLASKQFDVVLLDLTSGDGGVGLFRALKERAGETPIVVLAGLDDEEVAVQAVAAGAQDYIVKGHVTNRYLANALRYAVTRHRLRERLVNAAHLDELTGLYNRRGFMHLGQQQLVMADRTKRGLLLLYVDLDNMKSINDGFGHRTGDQALTDVAAVLRKSFRKSDIIARIGGDEFAVLAIETAQKGKDVVLGRLHEHTKAFNTSKQRPYDLGMSVGCAVYDSDNACSIAALLDRADRLMYEDKSRRKKLGTNDA
jgi:diguanylate cyclase (GGDEF)-like protein